MAVSCNYILEWFASYVALAVKNPPANAREVRDKHSIPGSGRSLKEGMATHSSILAWRIPRTEEPFIHTVTELDTSEGT